MLPIAPGMMPSIILIPAMDNAVAILLEFSLGVVLNVLFYTLMVWLLRGWKRRCSLEAPTPIHE